MLALSVSAYAQEGMEFYWDDEFVDLSIGNLPAENGIASISGDTGESALELMKQELTEQLAAGANPAVITNRFDSSLDGDALQRRIAALFFNTLYDNPEATFRVRTQIGEGGWVSSKKISFPISYLDVDQAQYTAAVDAAYAPASAKR